MAPGVKGSFSEELELREGQHCKEFTALHRPSLPFLEKLCEMDTSEGRTSTPTRDPQVLRGH